MQKKLLTGQRSARRGLVFVGVCFRWDGFHSQTSLLSRLRKRMGIPDKTIPIQVQLGKINQYPSLKEKAGRKQDKTLVAKNFK